MIAFTSVQAGAWIFAGLFIVIGLIVALCALGVWVDETKGGYRSGDKPVDEYRRPPAGPAPGAKR